MRSMQHATRNEKAAKIDRPRVLLQLRTGGVLEAVRVTRMGFPSRFIHRDFLHRFRVLAPLVTHADPRQHCVMLMGSLKPPLPTTDYQVRRWRSTPSPSPPLSPYLALPAPRSRPYLALLAHTALARFPHSHRSLRSDVSVCLNPFLRLPQSAVVAMRGDRGSRCGLRRHACDALPSRLSRLAALPTGRRGHCLLAIRALVRAALTLQVGLTKIFFRQDVSEQLEKRRERQMLQFIIVIQCYSRMWICRRKAPATIHCSLRSPYPLFGRCLANRQACARARTRPMRIQAELAALFAVLRSYCALSCRSMRARALVPSGSKRRCGARSPSCNSRRSFGLQCSCRSLLRLFIPRPSRLFSVPLAHALAIHGTHEAHPSLAVGPSDAHLPYPYCHTSDRSAPCDSCTMQAAVRRVIASNMLHGCMLYAQHRTWLYGAHYAWCRRQCGASSPRSGCKRARRAWRMSRCLCRPLQCAVAWERMR